MTHDQIVREMAAIEAELARRTVLGFTVHTYQGFEPNWHHERLAEALDRVVEGSCKRLMVFQPPQHGKTELVSRRLPAYLLGRNPDLRIVAGAYNSERATEVSLDVQRIIESDAYRMVFPDTRLATDKDPEQRTAAKFRVVGHEGSYQAAGVGQGIAGKSMDVGIIDDPIRSRADAESEAYRRTVWNWWANDITKRQVSADARMILVQTRWHEDDLAGRLLRLAREDPRADQWEVMSFPAICEEVQPNDPRQLGEALWPARFPRNFLDAQRALGVYEWSSLYQQSPVPAGGGMFKRHWFKVGHPRAGIVRRCRAWDCAGTVATPGRDPDWTVGTRMAQTSDGLWIIEDVIRTRATAYDVDQLMLQTARSDGKACLIREEEEPGSSGKSVVASHTRLLAGFDYAGVRGTGEKSIRWRPFAVQAEGGNVVLLPSERWHRAWLDEMTLVPYGRHDDQADSVALAFNTLADFKSPGLTAAAILPGSATVGGPTMGAWQEEYFRR